MLEDLSDIIITGVISGAAFEFLKKVFIDLRDWLSEKSLPFTIGGDWGAYHERNPYSALEFLVIRHRGNKIQFKLYQKTNDGRFHFYIGTGYIRGSKVSLAYQEANKNRSNLTGTFNLKTHNVSEHCLGLVGEYTEFSKDEKECSSYPYELKEFNASFLETVLITVLRKNYIKYLMGQEKFKNVCKSEL